MIFLYFLQLVVSILIFVPATVLIVGSRRFPGKGAKVAGKVGIIVMILSAVIIVCSTCYAIKYGEKGLFESPLMVNNL